MRHSIYLNIVFFAASALVAPQANAQRSTSDMERMLNQVDTQAPIQQMAPQQMNAGGFGGQQMQQMAPQGLFNQSPMPSQQGVNAGHPFGISSLFNNGQAAPAQRAPFTRRDLLRVFLEGGSPTQSGGNNNDAQKQANNQRKYNSAASYRQTAEDASMRALGAEQRSQYGSKSSRNSAANEAYYAASAARGAANSATSAAAGGALNANEAASAARNAANRAQASADRARSNANSAHDD
ncbi:MAG: hypothetical protein IAF58_12795 [Leptolyngbya sp.]|nr:hypothetical protein [Candidatus Melainabacteria bacterium]